MAAIETPIDAMRGKRGVLLLVLLYAAIRLALLSANGVQMPGPDDYMRLQQVADLLAGQSWWDMSQHRMGAIAPFSMHWSRLVDLPLALVALAFDLFLPRREALIAAAALVAMLYLVPLALGLYAIMHRIGLGQRAASVGLPLLLLFPLFASSFAPLAIDHHAPQAVMAVLTAWLLLRGGTRATAAAGLLAAAWVTISLEGLPLVAGFAGIVALGYWRNGGRQLATFLGALALGALALALLTRPLRALAEGYCDVLLPGHMLTFALAAGLAAALRHAPRQDSAKGRLLALGVLPLACLPLAFATLGPCVLDPMGPMAPLLRSYWHSYVLEGLPVTRQPLSVMAMLVWTLLVPVAGLWVLRREGRLSEAWAALFLAATLANIYALAVLRAALVGQLLSLPFAVVLVAHFLPRARALPSAAARALATVAALLAPTPGLASALAKPWDRAKPVAQWVHLPEPGTCDYRSLRVLQPGLIFAPIDPSPQILVLTSHRLAAGPYHRNGAQMLGVIDGFSLPEPAARRAIVGSGADYVALCLASGDATMLGARSPDALVNALARGEAPSWLAPVPGFDRGILRVWRVRR